MDDKKEQVIETTEYKIVLCEYYTEVTIGNRRITVKKGDCYTLDYDETPEHDTMAASPNIETIAKFIAEELKKPQFYSYILASWKDGSLIDSETFCGR
ncbi:hypothetical protein CN272_22115 [Bacillus anthracis]|nr:hypothetical protein CN272_22115 [Bacillus anthracis]